jgi:hypothetical protein
LVSQMYAPSPLSMIGTGRVAKLDIRVKCIHRCSAALLWAGVVVLSSVIMLSVIGTPIVVRTSNSVTVTDGRDLEVKHQPMMRCLLVLISQVKITILLRVTR